MIRKDRNQNFVGVERIFTYFYIRLLFYVKIAGHWLREIRTSSEKQLAESCNIENKRRIFETSRQRILRLHQL
jgi:hypothetical protein